MTASCESKCCTLRQSSGGKGDNNIGSTQSAKMFRRAIFLTYFALATAQYIPSDRPSDSPTYIPTAAPTYGWQSDSPSNVPTILATNINHVEQASLYSGGQFAVPIPAFTTCDSCTRFGTLSDLYNAVSNIVHDGKICMCPQTYSGDTCSSNETRPSITIESGQNVTIECASGGISMCTFQCPNTLVQVNSGGIFNFVGNSRTEVISSTIASRIIVERYANATITQVLFTRYVPMSTPLTPEIQLIQNPISLQCFIPTKENNDG